MYLKKFKKSIFLLLFFLTIFPINVLAYSDRIIAGGQNIGISLNSDGVLIVGTYEVNNTSPAKEAGLKTGDIIEKINGNQISSIEDMATEINKLKDESIEITYKRENKEKETNLKLYKDENNIYKTGLYVKDSVTGIGTLTFIDPATKKFGALGHEIQEQTTGKTFEIKDGSIFTSEVTGIIPSTDGTPGEKKAEYNKENVTGTVDENTIRGIFGTYTDQINKNKTYNVAQPNEIKKGKAKILTVLNGNDIKEYDINIIQINPEKQKTKNFVFEITDKNLLNKTGGIIQGMSGSPIIQGDNIVGAVTHVVVNNPNKGYGIFITNMLEEAEN